MRIDTNASALNVISVSQQATANNIANMNTDEYRAQEVMRETGPQGEGVRVSEVRESSAQGPIVDTMVVESTEDGGTEQVMRAVEGSNTDIVREQVNMIENQRAYEANIEAIRTQDDMLGTVINELV